MASTNKTDTPNSGESSQSIIEKYGRLEGRGAEFLKLIGFQMEVQSDKTAKGKFVVGENSCQPYGVLHGGTTAYIAESIASLAGAYACNFQQVAGIELNVNHLRPAPVGSEVMVTASPFLLGSRLQVWEVKFETEKLRKPESGSQPPQMALVAVSRVTIIVGVPKKES